MSASARRYLFDQLAAIAAEAQEVDQLQQEISEHDDFGTARGSARFADNSTLFFTLVLEVDDDAVVVLKYRFHYAAPGNETVFRYDNSGHHRKVATFPHHKHVGPDESVVASGPVTVEDVLVEVRAAMKGR